MVRVPDGYDVLASSIEFRYHHGQLVCLRPRVREENHLNIKHVTESYKSH